MSDLIATARTAAELGVNSSLRTHSEFYATVLASNYSISDWLIDKNVDREESRFILLSTKTPFLADIQNADIEDRNLRSEFSCEGELVEGLGFAFLLEYLALSIRSEPKWDTSSLVIEVTWLEDDNNLSSEILTIVHASRLEHLQSHITWIQNRLKTGVRDGLDLWNRRSDLFSSLTFCETVGKQVQSLSSGSPMLRQIVKRLFELENYCKNWTSGSFNKDSLPCKVSPESDTRLQQFEQKLTFRCPDGERRIFSWHVRMTPGAWRLHFSVESGPRKIIIGYIGPKIQ
ncbi:hypothetical protein [Floridanema evergladense]|uniref:Uncharacterized protein n=1 Tax=Floridaenema evergladense BLCC-F167 TaxID=3153639 RepID=A0ABV4WLA3_9CYAN